MSTDDRKKVAAVITWYKPLSHADVIVTKYLTGFPTDEGFFPPRTELVSMYVDQFPEEDLSRELAEKHSVPIYGSIDEALCCGGNQLAVDAVLLIGEHGRYPWNEKQQQLFPRKPFMEQICGAMATAGRGVPVFNDKHLSYNWHDAKWMYERARQLDAPFMAGSSLPVCWRDPWLEHELETPLQEAVAVGFSGLDIYGFHTLEVLQCMFERRVGGETGVAAVTCLEGDDVWNAKDDWWRDLAQAACDAIESKPEGGMQENCESPALFLVEYRDGCRGAILMLNGYITDLAYAGRVEGEMQACAFYAQGHGGDAGRPHAHFSYLSLNVEEMFLTGKPQYPVERTLLTTGVLEAALTSRYEGHVRLETPWLDVTYQSYDSFKWRPTAPSPHGASLFTEPPG